MSDVSTLTIIRPESDDFDKAVGQSGQPDVVTPVLNPAVEAALADGLTTFQLPDGAEITNGKTTRKLTVGMVRSWASDPAKYGAVAPDGKRFRISGGKGRNISVTLVDAEKTAK